MPYLFRLNCRPREQRLAATPGVSSKTLGQVRRSQSEDSDRVGRIRNAAERPVYLFFTEVDRLIDGRKGIVEFETAGDNAARMRDTDLAFRATTQAAVSIPMFRVNSSR